MQIPMETSNELLRFALEERKLTVPALAKQMTWTGDSQLTSRIKTVRRWLDGSVHTPHESQLQQLERIFGKTPAELGFYDEGEIPFWLVPHARNPFFSGRRDILAQLTMSRLKQRKTHTPLVPQALIGASGIGKTQIALEYAYVSKRQHRYHTIAWLRANTAEVLAADFADLAGKLKLLRSEKDTGQEMCLQAVKAWLRSPYISRWLFIFDQVEHPEALQTIFTWLPSHCYGHVIITTSLAIPTSEVQRIPIEAMNPVEGAELLLKQLYGPSATSAESENDLARTISHLLGGLPPKLEQVAGAIRARNIPFMADLANLSLEQLREIVSLQHAASVPDMLQGPAMNPSLAAQAVPPALQPGENSGLPISHHEAASLPQLTTAAKAPMRIPDGEVIEYLRRLESDYRLVGLEGITPVPGVVINRVELDEVFIPVLFRPNWHHPDLVMNQPEVEQVYEALKRENTAGERERPQRSRSARDSQGIGIETGSWQGLAREDLENILYEFERSWVRSDAGEAIPLSELWQRLAALPVSAAVIQGYPGMGKSTLLARIALHMARRCLVLDDPEMKDTLTPEYLPILVKIGDYARARASDAHLSLREYVKKTLDNYLLIDHSTLGTLLEETYLARGRCLVMFDGLDEVSVDKPHIRQQVQEEIKRFIGQEFPGNRFLITSRVAGYEQRVFPDYTIFLLAPLTNQLIETFLPRWCRANVRKMRGLTRSNDGAEKASIEAEAQPIAATLMQAIRTSPGIRLLAENPLLLTLLATLKLSRFNLPERRVELYDIVTRTFHEERNIEKKLDWMPEPQVISFLGPLAYKMQESGASFVPRSVLVEHVHQAIALHQGGSPDEVQMEAERFIDRLRERGGIFVLRVGDFFGFFHRSFQEYFVARYLLDQIEQVKVEQQREEEIRRLANLVRGGYDVWREPFLLAVTYASGVKKTTAHQILTTLLDIAQEAGDTQRDALGWVDTLLLIAESIVESRPFTIEVALQEYVASALLTAYEQAQLAERFSDCEKIEEVMRHWLLTVPAGAYRPVPLITLELALKDAAHPATQRTVLTLLALISQDLAGCPPIVFKALIEPLLSLAGLPAVGEEYQPVKTLAPPSNLTLNDLAMTILSFLGQNGPAGLLLGEARQHFKNHPSHLRLLARYSVESATLLTPVVIPLDKEKARLYEAVLQKWLELRKDEPPGVATEAEIDQCAQIHQELLNCAEEVCYPSVTHLLTMLERSAGLPDQPWQEVWQDYLRSLLTSGGYQAYQEAVLLWTTIFPEQERQYLVAMHILRDYEQDGKPEQRYAQHVIALLANDVTEPRELRHMFELRYLHYLRDLSYRQYIRDLSTMPTTRNLRYLSYLRRLHSMSHMGFVRLMRYQRYLRYLLLTQDVARHAMKRLSQAEAPEYLDLLTILFGRVRQIQDQRRSKATDQEHLEEIAEALKGALKTMEDAELREALLFVLSFLTEGQLPPNQ